MTISRRTFLSSAGAIGVTTMILPGEVFAGMVTLKPKSLRAFDYYVKRIDDWFYLYNEDASHQSNLELVDVTDDGSNKQLEKFSLTLCSDLQDVAIPSGYYQVAGERFALFVQHTDEQMGWQFYRATFALLR